MATKINKEDLVRSVKPEVVKPGESEEPGFIDGANSFIQNINTALNSANKLIGTYRDLKGKLPGQKPIGQPNAPIAYKQAPVERAIRPQEQPAPKPEEKPQPEENKEEKARQLFKELHEGLKPHLPMAGNLSALQVVQWALQPVNKEKIISEIAKRL